MAIITQLGGVSIDGKFDFHVHLDNTLLINTGGYDGHLA